MRTSETIEELADALVKAQSSMGKAVKGSTNPHLKNKYADLASVWDACHQPLNENGITVIQGVEGEGTGTITVSTMLLHSSGQWIEATGSMPIPNGNKAVNEAQSAGIAISYMRRYQLAAIAMVAQEDTDGAQGNVEPHKPQESTISCAELVDKFKDTRAWPHLEAAWKKYTPDMAKMTEQEKALCTKTKNDMKASFAAALAASDNETTEPELDGMPSEPDPS
jgi:hypothetical protein